MIRLLNRSSVVMLREIISQQLKAFTKCATWYNKLRNQFQVMFPFVPRRKHLYVPDHIVSQ